MNIFISYFYKVRFMRPHEIPLSTAVWDPKWFHDFQEQDHIFIDKNGVLNGVRAGVFAPGDKCSGLCHGIANCHWGISTTCPFLRRYREQIETIDFQEFYSRMEQLSRSFQEDLELNCPVDFILLVHEAPSNPCSERIVLQKWFSDNGMKLKEWDRS